MVKKLVLLGFSIFLFGTILGFYASQRNCIIAFLTRGYMSFWTAIEIFSGIIALFGLVITLYGIFSRN